MAIIVRTLDPALPGRITALETEEDLQAGGEGIHSGVEFKNAYVVITSDPQNPFNQISTIVVHNTETGERIVVELG